MSNIPFSLKAGHWIFIIFQFCTITSSTLIAQRPFITTWQTDLPGESEDHQILIEGTGSGYTIEWKEVGNPAISGVETGEGETLLTFPYPGVYRISISGNFGGFPTQGLSMNDSEKLLSIDQWGDIKWKGMVGAFSFCINMTSDATDRPDLSEITSLAGMFHACYSFNSNIGHWDISNVRNLAGMFQAAASFNQPLENWDVSNVQFMERLFWGADNFNQNINNWDVSQVINMSTMFGATLNFNQPLDQWNVSNVEDMRAIFLQAQEFNKPLDNWNVGNVRDMSFMFSSASNFDQSLSNWNVSNVREMRNMFSRTSQFDQSLSNWDVSNVRDMRNMFLDASQFDQSLSNWDVSNVRDMRNMFLDASQFDQSLSNWDLSKVSEIENMLSGSGMSCVSYDSTLIGWSSNPNTPDSLVLGAEGLIVRYGQSARDSLRLKKGWTFIGDKFAPCECVILPNPEIKLVGPPLVCPSDSTILYATIDAEQYVWYRDGKLLSDENDRELIVREGGNYSLQYKSADDFECESGFSNSIFVADGADGNSPLMLNSDDLSLTSLADGCQGFAFFEADVRSCSNLSVVEDLSVWKIDLFNTGTFDIYSDRHSIRNNLIINEPLPLGTHRVLWVLRDEYGNEAQYQHLLSLSDKNPPTPVCLHGISTSLGNNGEVALKAEMFDAGSWDDCSKKEDLIFSFSADINHTHHQWTCGDLEGQRQFHVPVEIWVTNEFGSQNHCHTYLLLQDFREVCPDIGSFKQTISGKVTNVHGQAVEHVDVQMIGNEIPSFLHSQTDVNGAYLFNSIGPEYTQMKAQKEGRALNGLSTMDILLIKRHILGIQTLESPYSQIAADVNQDGKINVLDVNEIRKLLLGNSDGFSKNKNWINLPEQPLEGGWNMPIFSEVLYLPLNQEKKRKYNWTAVKTGDVNHSHQLNTSTERTERESHLIQLKEVDLKADQMISVPFQFDKINELKGFQFTLKFPPGKLEYLDFSTGIVPLKDSHLGFTELENGLIRISWSDALGIQIPDKEELFTLDFKVKSPGPLSKTLWISEQHLNPEIYTSEGLKGLKLVFESTAETISGGPFLSIQPNPFKELVAIEFDLEFSSQIQFSLMDISGREIMTHSKMYHPGFNQIEISGEKLPAPGLYFFKLQTSEWQKVGRMIFQE